MNTRWLGITHALFCLIVAAMFANMVGGGFGAALGFIGNFVLHKVIPNPDPNAEWRTNLAMKVLMDKLDDDSKKQFMKAAVFAILLGFLTAIIIGRTHILDAAGAFLIGFVTTMMAIHQILKKFLF